MSQENLDDRGKLQKQEAIQLDKDALNKIDKLSLFKAGKDKPVLTFQIVSYEKRDKVLYPTSYEMTFEDSKKTTKASGILYEHYRFGQMNKLIPGGRIRTLRKMINLWKDAKGKIELSFSIIPTKATKKDFEDVMTNALAKGVNSQRDD